jgi:transcriptional regulator with PAS, ATPase and Fis domain
MADAGYWFDGFPGAITITDVSGVIIAMNARSRETFASDGGGALIGRSVFDCHPDHVHSKLRALYTERNPNSYTIEKEGNKKIIHQIPWFKDDVFAGMVEISLPIPEVMPHFKRD